MRQYHEWHWRNGTWEPWCDDCRYEAWLLSRPREQQRYPVMAEDAMTVYQAEYAWTPVLCDDDGPDAESGWTYG